MPQRMHLLHRNCVSKLKTDHQTRREHWHQKLNFCWGMYRSENFAFRHNTQFAHSTVTNPSGGRRESGRLVGRTISEQTSLYKQAECTGRCYGRESGNRQRYASSDDRGATGTGRIKFSCGKRQLLHPSINENGRANTFSSENGRDDEIYWAEGDGDSQVGWETAAA